MDLPRNRRRPSELAVADVEAAIGRIRLRDNGLADEAEHVVDSLTWGEGPGVIRQAGVQEWLWFIVPTKYLTDEVGYMGRLAETAAILFDGLALNGYAAICRSEETRKVHAAFAKSDRAGRAALRKAIDRSGIGPPDLADFEWSSVMRTEEAGALLVVEAALEEAIFTGEMAVGARGWRAVQADVTIKALDGNHPVLPGQSWRTAVTTERIEQWVSGADRLSPTLVEARSGIANRLLHPVAPPDSAEAAVAPITWLLQRWGDEQPLTQAGYLKPAFVKSLQADRPWGDPLPLDRAVKNELDDLTLHSLRMWLQQAGAVRKHKSMLRRSSLGAAMAADWRATWDTLTRHLGGDGWDGFVAETAILFLVSHAGPASDDAVLAFVRSVAIEMGWQTTGDGVAEAPSAQDVNWSLAEARHTWEPCGLVVRDGDWRNRRYALTKAGETAALTYLRHGAAGPKESPV